MYNPEALKTDAEKLRKSSYFDSDWHLEKYKDVAILKMDPAEHYLKYGAMMRRVPGPDFSTGFYIDTHPENLRKRANPVLQHEHRKGKPIAPEPRAVLWAAYNMSRSYGHDHAIDMQSAICLKNPHIPLVCCVRPKPFSTGAMTNGRGM